jgi:hypothetical protein
MISFSPEECQRRWTIALAALERLKAERPIGSGGLKYTRDELYQRKPEVSDQSGKEIEPVNNEET